MSYTYHRRSRQSETTVLYFVVGALSGFIAGFALAVALL